MASDNFPYDLLKKNMVFLSLHRDIIEFLDLKKVDDFDYIISSNKTLSNMAIPDARKEVAKAIYAIGRQPEINKNGHSTKEVMGSVGEALTELLIPGNYVTVNNTGYDVEFCGNYIEVKSTITEKVTMSNKQYTKANYLLIHKFDKHTNKHRLSILVPLDIVHAYKPKRDKSVSISTKIDVWARNLTITLPRVVSFFNMFKANENHPKNIVHCQSCHKEIVKNNVINHRSLADTCDNCEWGNWELRYFYYKYLYVNQPSLLTTKITRLELNNTYHCIYIPSATLQKETTMKDVFIELTARENRKRLYYCPSWRNTKRNDNIDSIKALPKFFDLLKECVSPFKTIMEFEVIILVDTTSLMVRGHKGGAKPGFFYEEYRKGEEPNALAELLEEMGL